MNEVLGRLKQWKLDLNAVRERVYRAPTPRERERWHALWLLAEGWSAVQVAEALERNPHTIGEWLASFRRAGPSAPITLPLANQRRCMRLGPVSMSGAGSARK